MKHLALAAFIILGLALAVVADWGRYRYFGGDLALVEYVIGHKL